MIAINCRSYQSGLVSVADPVIKANSVDRRLDDTAFVAGQDPVHSWKARPGEVITIEN